MFSTKQSIEKILQRGMKRGYDEIRVVFSQWCLYIITITCIKLGPYIAVKQWYSNILFPHLNINGK